MAVVFYISGHGFGHASRDVEVINALGVIRGVPPVVIRSAVAPDLLARTLRGPYTLVPGECDTGVVQTTSVAHDDEATVEAAVAFYRTFAARVDVELAQLQATPVELIVGDVPPIAFEVSARLGVPAIAMANFTWDWIYEAHPGFLPGAAPVIETIRGAYGQATLALELPFSGGFDVFPRVSPIPLVARRPSASRAATRARLGLPRRGRVALLSFGGYGMPSLDLAQVDCREDWTIVTTDRTSPVAGAPPAHVTFVSSAALMTDVRYEDVVAAADVVITKPGYGIIAECIAADTPMLYTSRGHFREYDLLVAALPRVLRSRFISQTDLFAGRWRSALEGLIGQPDAPDRIAINGAEVAAAILADWASGLSSVASPRS